MPARLYGNWRTKKLTATVSEVNWKKVNMLAEQHGVSVSRVVNLLLQRAQDPEGFEEAVRRLAEQREASG